MALKFDIFCYLKSILIAKLPKKLLLYKIKAQLNGAVSKEKMPKTDNFYALDNAMTTILTTNKL